jgi:hypothetical protein
VKNLITKTAKRFAPRTVRNIKTLSALDESFDQGPARFLSYEREIRALRREIDEIRRDNRRVAELYDAVFEYVRRDAADRGVAPSVDGPATVERVADVLTPRSEA